MVIKQKREGTGMNTRIADVFEVFMNLAVVLVMVSTSVIWM